MLSRLFKANPEAVPARALYQAIVDQARQPAFYSNCGVPDSLDGRFELIALHSFLVMHRLKQDHERTAGLAQELFDILFFDMDVSLREMGVGDLGVGRRVKAMAQGFYGRVAAYEGGLDSGSQVLAEALARNLFGTVAASPAAVRGMADYVVREAAGLAVQPLSRLVAGEIEFGPPPAANLVDLPADSGPDGD